ncbi:MAG: hypothetical protein K8I02_10570, partial [Candidatus Methylomirabilis sp.]|nr:hypothetical protein [Deltaproteobacteria bacterium]
GYMSADGLVRPPVARPDLRQYDESYSDILGTVVAQGATLTVDYDVVNMGYAGSGTVTVDFYLSTNTTITTGDRYIGTRTVGSLNPFQYANPRAAFSIASNTPLGTYYVGWIMRCPTTEYTTANNAAVITEETVQIIEPVECGTARTSGRADAAAIATLGLVFASLLARRRRARA